MLLNSALAASCLLDLAPDVALLVYLHEEGEALELLTDGARAGLVDHTKSLT